MLQIDWTIPRISNPPIDLALKNGDQLFIVGANGSGKSALIHKLVSDQREKKIKRITAHRQTCFASGSINLTPENRQQYERDRLGYDRSLDALRKLLLLNLKLRFLLMNRRSTSIGPLFNHFSQRCSTSERIARLLSRLMKSLCQLRTQMPES